MEPGSYAAFVMRSHSSFRGPLVRTTMLAILCASLAWALWLAVFGGFDVTLLGLRIRSNDPRRLVIVAALALAGFFLAGGTIPMSWREIVRGWVAALPRRPGWIAAGVAMLLVIAATAGSTRIAGQADAYGYVSQADLWLDGNLKIRQPWVKQVPWPNSDWTFSPLGYRPAASKDEWAIVPTYSPGLPILMAAAKFVAGQCGLFAVTPLFAGLAVLATYGLGCRLGSPVTGLGGAWLVATSPIVISSMMEPATDVPVMAAWAISFYFLLGNGLRSAAAAGLLAALAILIRPNLVLLVGPMAVWFFVRRAPAATGIRERLLAACVFGLGVLPGVLAVAIINQHLHGSPATSGYGPLSEKFAWVHVVPNIGRYFSWFVETQTPIALLGMAALAFPVRRLWPNADRTTFIVIGLFVVVLWGEYFAYIVFDSWGYLRFVLPSWPFIMLGLAAVFVAATRFPGQTAQGTRGEPRLNRQPVQWVVGAMIIALGLWGLHFAERTGQFDQRQAARHEAPIGHLVRGHTNRNSVVLAMARSGSLRYYAGRTTLRYDLLEPDWLDRAVAWMTERGVHVYAVLDEFHAAECKRRFAGQRLTAAFDRPVLVYEPAGTALFDLSTPPDAGSKPIVISKAFDDVPGCDPPYKLAPLVLR